MTDELRTKIRAEIDEATWTPLAMHAKREALFLVDASLDLGDAAYALASNRTSVVAHWLERGLLRRPTPEERARFDLAPEERSFRFVIVQPYVLAASAD